MAPVTAVASGPEQLYRQGYRARPRLTTQRSSHATRSGCRRNDHVHVWFGTEHAQCVTGEPGHGGRSARRQYHGQCSHGEHHALRHVYHADQPGCCCATAAALGVLTPIPCMPVIPAPWTPGALTVMLGNMPALDNTSICMCAWGGVISITFPGQVTVMEP